VKRFHRKRKAPATRSNPVKIQKKDVNLAAETLLELSTTALHDANEVGPIFISVIILIDKLVFLR
jgi:hypothetical protein